MVRKKQHYQQQGSNISLSKRRETNEIPEQNSAAGEIKVDGNTETEELGEAMKAMLFIEGKMKKVGSDNGEMVQVSGGYRRDRPPEDDCCPICHDDFQIPCRTNCGHWFCANCILHVWKYMTNFKQCVCPICGSLIFNLVPYSPSLIQPGEEVSEILKEIQRYSSQNMVGWFGILKKAIPLPQITRERMQNISSAMRIATLLLRLDRIVDQTYGFRLFSNGVLMLFCMCAFAVLIFVIWKRWNSLRWERQRAEQKNVIP